MISPLKHQPVNWVDGMKLSSAHFIATDQYNQDIIRDTRSLYLNSFNYGLLPPFSGQHLSQEIEITERATNHVEVKIRHFNAITAGGCRIDIDGGASEDKQLFISHYFKENTETRSIAYHIILVVNPFERVPSGVLDPQDSPPRYPDVSKGYHLSILPVSEMAAHATDNYSLVIGQLILAHGKITISNTYIPPSSTMGSHTELIRYHEHFGVLMNDLQLSAFKIIDKTMGKEAITVLGRNVRSVSEKLLDYIAQLFFSYRNFGLHQTPLQFSAHFSNLAHIFFTAIKLIEVKEREEMLKYFYEWRDVTPGNFEELLARNIQLSYDHQDIYAAMSVIDEFLKVVTALWKKLSVLEYIGQHKENIVVAEQRIVQQTQARTTWTLLD